MESAEEITAILHAMRQGDNARADDLMNAVYADLKKAARRYMAAEREDHTLQPTVIVNEVFLRMFRPAAAGSKDLELIPIDWQSRSHFLGVAARQMRRFLVDHSRQKRAEKRDFGIKVSWEDAAVASSAVSPEHEFDTIDQLLTLLAAKDPDAAKVVELKFFGGLTDKEAAHYMNVNVTKVRRDWEFARGWLRLRLPGRARANAARA